MEDKITLSAWATTSRGRKFLAGLGVAFFVSAAPSAFAQAKITEVSTDIVEGGLRIDVKGIELGRPREIRTMRNSVYMIEFDALLGGNIKPKKIATRRSTGADTVQYGWFSARPPRIRVSVHLTNPDITPVLTQVENGWMVTINGQAKAGSDSVLAKPTNSLPLPVARPGAREDTTPLLVPAKDSNTPDWMSLSPRNPEPVAVDNYPYPVDQAKPTQTKPAQTKPAQAKPEQTKPVATKPEQSSPQKPPFKTQVMGTAVERGKMISLDFVATDVNLVLKALASQSGANIVTAPNMNGRVTVSLTQVPIESALDYTTFPAGLRWEKVRGNTYVVAPKDKLREIVNDLSRRDQSISTTRIVPIFSGDILQIKETVSRAFEPSTANGSFEMILSSEIMNKKSESSSSSQGGGAEGGGGGQEGGGKEGGGKEGGDAGAGSGAAGVDPGKGGGGSGSSSKETQSKISMAPLDNLYVILIGNTEMVDRVADYVKDLDAKICASYGVEVSESATLSTETYLIKSKTLKANALIDNIKVQGIGQSFPKVAMHASPVTGERQSVIIVGRSGEIARAKRLLSEFDGAGDDILVVDLKYSDPRTVRDQVIAYVPGLQVSFGPGAAGSPRLYSGALGADNVTKGQKGDGAGGAGTAAEDVKVKGEGTDFDTNISQPYNDLEKTAQPMRLILRGTDEQIAKALAYIAKVDTEPKQIAIDMRVVELTKDEATKLGIDWGLSTGGIARNLVLGQSTGITGAAGSAKLTSPSGSITALLDSLDGQSKVLARPNLLAIDGRETEVFIGETIRYVESIQSTQNGVTVTTKDIGVGIRLSTIARIGDDGKIQLELRPVIRSLSSFTAIVGGGQLPQTVDRVLQSTVIANSGDTIALGGLITDSEVRSMRGIPFLKDLPLIGRLFRSETKNHARKEVVFFITVKEVNSENRARAAAPREAEKRSRPVEEQKAPEVQKKKKGI
ncbi:MAG: hypothetical protein K8R88_13430 [Armatimonadetes bacterium]|nr:hypothetical protein [Armatimonadota bacterium]